MSDDAAAEPRPTIPFPGEAEPAPASAPVDLLAGDWSADLRGPAKPHGLPEPRLLGAAPPPLPEGQEQLAAPPSPRPAVQAAADESVEAPDDWGASDEEPLSFPPPPAAAAPAEAPLAQPESTTPPEAAASAAEADAAVPEHVEAVAAEEPVLLDAADEAPEQPLFELRAEESVDAPSDEPVELGDRDQADGGHQSLESALAAAAQEQGVFELHDADALLAEQTGSAEAAPAEHAPPEHEEASFEIIESVPPPAQLARPTHETAPEPAQAAPTEAPELAPPEPSPAHAAEAEPEAGWDVATAIVKSPGWEAPAPAAEPGPEDAWSAPSAAAEPAWSTAAPGTDDAWAAQAAPADAGWGSPAAVPAADWSMPASPAPSWAAPAASPAPPEVAWASSAEPSVELARAEAPPPPGSKESLFGSLPVGASLSDEEILEDPDLPVAVEEPEPAPAPLVGLGLAGEHRVAVHTRGGNTRRGIVRDVDLAKSQFSLQPQGGGSAETVYHAEVKAIFFMLPPGEKAQVGDGERVRVTFADGRTIEGNREGGEGKHGFFLVPADAQRTNTRRIYVARDAVAELREL